jgi:hypothetical protein
MLGQCIVPYGRKRLLEQFLDFLIDRTRIDEPVPL